MSKSFLTPIGLFSAATDPSSASIGNVYFNTASNVMRLYFNSQWNSVHNVTASYGLDADHIDFSTNPSSAASVARLQWSPGEGTLSFGLGGGDVFLNIGQEELAYCYNGTASTLTKGTVVYISGAQGQRPTIDKASASAEGESSKTLGVVAEDITSGSDGFVCTSGILRNVNTASFAEGSALWLSTTPGQMTTNKSYAPNHLVFIGYSIKQSANAGQIFVKIQNGFELYELHNVSASAPANNDILVYNTSSSLWFNSSSANLTNLTVSNTINGRAASANLAITASNVLVSPSAIYADRIDFVTSPVSAASVGRMTWNATSGTVELGMDNGPSLITTLIGQSLYVKATNKDSASMTRGDVVYISGAIGQRVAIRLASASANGIDKSPIGMCAEDIAVNAAGFVIVKGTISGINTQAYTEGDAVWLSASPGKITNIRPPAPLGANVIGHIINSNIANGSINVTVIDGAKLSFLNDVVLTASTFSNNDILAYNLSASYWENTSIQNKITTASVGYANVAGHASTASSINASLLTGTTLPATIVNSSLTSVGTLSSLTTTGNIKSGLNSGGVALTINDGYGNANVTWNHLSGIPEQNGNAARIEVNTDATSGAYFSFELKSNVASGVAVSLTNVLDLYETYANFLVEVRTPSISASVISASALTVTNTISGRAASANVATHAGTASSIAGSLVTGTVSNASHANTASSINASLVSGSFGSGGVVINSNEGASNTSALSAMTGRLIFSNAFSDTARGPNKVQMYNDASAWIGGFGVHAETLSYYTGGAHRWYRSSNQTTFTELMALSASGFLGIATNSPASALHVIGAALVTTNLNVDSGTLYVDGTSNAVNVGTTSHLGAKMNILNDVSGSVGFLLRGAAGQSVSTFRIQSSGGTNTVNINSETGGGYFEGNFGIGVLVPTTKLDVDGSALIRTNASVTGNLLVDTNTLFVDATNNEVGILTTSPASALHVAGGLLINGNASFGGTITGTSTTQAVGNSSTSLATTEFVSRSVKYSADTSVNTSSVAGFFVFNVSGTASLGGVIMMPRGTASRVIVGQANIGINGAASAGFVRGYVENNAGTAVAIGGAVPFYYIAW